MHGGASREPAGGRLETQETDALDSFFWATKIGGPSHGFDVESNCVLPIVANARHKAVLVWDSAFPEDYPCGRAHFRLVHDAETGAPVLYLEPAHADFAHRRADHIAFDAAVPGHAVRKSVRMGVPLSVESHDERQLRGLAPRGAAVERVRRRLRLAPSKGMVEASDTLCNLHDWVQLEEYVTPPLTRAVMTPPSQRGGEL